MRPETDNDRRYYRRRAIGTIAALGAMLTGVGVFGEQADQHFADGIVTDSVLKIVDAPFREIGIGAHHVAQWVLDHTPTDN